MKADAKEKLMQAAIRLLQGEREAESITVRDIAAEANVNVALINYYYKSKDELLYLAVGELMRDIVREWSAQGESPLSPYLRLRNMLITLCDITVQFERFTRISVQYEIVEAEIKIPQLLLPLMREISGGRRSEIQLRITAYEIISLLQLLYLRSAEFVKYAGVDIGSHDGRVLIVDAILSDHFPEGEMNDESL